MSSAGIAALNPTEEDSVLALFRYDSFSNPQFCEETIMIFLSMPGLATVPMRVMESESIASVKLKIQDYKGYKVKKQRLVCDGRELARSDSLVKDYGVGNGNVIHLVVRMSDLRMISVETSCGKKLQFQADGSRNVSYIKQQILDRGNGLVNLNGQKVLFDGEELDDHLQIADIHGERVIHLLVCDSAKVISETVGKDYELFIEATCFDEDTVLQKNEIIDNRILGRSSWIEPVVVNQNFELSSVIKGLVYSTSAGLDRGNTPVSSTEGSGGAYFMWDITGQRYVAVFKPTDEEPMAANNPHGLPLSQDGEGLKSGTRVGEGALREVAAYILDHPANGLRSFGNNEIGFSGVPPTVMVRCLHEAFNHPGGYHNIAKNLKIGSLQMFVKNNGSCEDMGPRAFPLQEVHKISVLDIRLANADRHGGNILVCKEGVEGKFSLVPIDHGYCLPENFEDCTFEWLYWPQAREPYNLETIDYIKSLDAEEDITLLKFHGWELSVECARTLRISTMLLKKGVERGFTPFIIGSILCRETVKKESMIEEIVREAETATLPCSSETTFMETVSEVMDCYLDKLSLQ